MNKQYEYFAKKLYSDIKETKKAKDELTKAFLDLEKSFNELLNLLKTK